MNLFAVDKDGKDIYCRQVRNKSEAKKMVLNNPWLFRTTTVRYKGKVYKIKEVYKWKE